MPVILGANSASGGYNITNSLRFNSVSNDYLDRTLTTPTNNKIFTWSGWVKRGNIGTSASQNIFRTAGGSSTGFRFADTGVDSNMDGIRFFFNNASDGDLSTTQKFRDVSAWYHLVVAVDTTQATASNRVKMYINGSQITAFNTATYPSQNYNPQMNSAITHRIGVHDTGENFDGYMSDIFFIDGQQLTPSSFGETDEDTGIWKPKAYTGTFGTNGFYLDFEDSANLGNDMSGNNNDFTVNNLTSIDQSTDTPTNNFATLNPNMISTTNVVLSEGNLKMVSNFASGWQHSGSTFAVKSGKWYWEAKATVVSATDKTSIGVVQFDTTQVNFQGNTNLDLATYGISGHGAGTGSYTYAQGDIIMCAMDLGNNKVYWGKNGTFYGTLNPSAGTGSTTQTIDNNNFCMPIVGGYGGSTWELNFGFPQFTIASGNADANGFGNFEYAVPSGYYALCTKNLAQFG